MQQRMADNKLPLVINSHAVGQLWMSLLRNLDYLRTSICGDHMHGAWFVCCYSSTAVSSTLCFHLNLFHQLMNFKVRLAYIIIFYRNFFMGFTFKLSLCGGKDERKVRIVDSL